MVSRRLAREEGHRRKFLCVIDDTPECDRAVVYAATRAIHTAGTISAMETFQKIYRPEIYNANSAAPAVYRPSLAAEDFSRTQIDYDREERSRLALTQGRYAKEHFIEPHREVLERWAAGVEAAFA